MKVLPDNNKYLFLLGAIVAVVGIGGYVSYKNIELNRENKALVTDLAESVALQASTTRMLDDTIALLASTQQNLTQSQNDLQDERAKVGNLANQVQNIVGTVGTLEKLSNTDPELLQKYSKVSFLNEHYIPKKLLQIDGRYVYEAGKDLWMLDRVKSALESLVRDAQARGLDLFVVSAYRSFDEQNDLKSSYTVVYGSGANQFSADQGYSEHQLGTTVDFTTREVGGTFLPFKDTNAYGWLVENAHRYGFILSYPENNDYYQFEPWHWRFVGKELARLLHDENKHFYDLDQREIDAYLVSIFD
ncbi:MAG: hypothetical protein COZ49_03310 [Candidatus Yonathbacteria bacterium CG_4_10_14_3_um_filter_47_65]|uniref:D-alanyl-D-alanine carboxypeptidase-like core domain-containing protein n=2 Tax=Parcubacteria group TaxID=1794811 RepID=A0A2M8D5W4_9BACT|nr:MAG: hypothetical protein AUJ44_02385 [Candidatus Nomurabacteria bacterium CG1_02_47_685]PIP04122.1 MAG: hypothetical protein COX54_00820 [Candidatus Yonathbacteria bacterium CG23_combo_of_CG06-09_8_20_14_all_46_18]PIQ32576.1 MAG: hypothetical protein COW61_01425 [Candidatus Yonathbacteria bacterium CG17_big_fil_post_rev_8_21_14_2_50_46_19]PIX56208.1 MAG: hypothetical protein COZ49_03310 [Candidatus Yonathbacteria bacterium CG_4_10_14_3_um_filter_47_65]PIY57747.1 MAG: hypothetical protein CO